jgi:hypothetical protein
MADLLWKSAYYILTWFARGIVTATLACQGSVMVQRVATVAFEGVEARAVDVQVQVAAGSHYRAGRTPDDVAQMTRFFGLDMLVYIAI